MDYMSLILGCVIILGAFLLGHIMNLATEAVDLAKQDRAKLESAQDAGRHLTEELEATNELLQAYREENKRMLDAALHLSQPNTMIDAYRDRASYYVELQDIAKRLEIAEHAYLNKIGHGELDRQLDELFKGTALETK